MGQSEVPASTTVFIFFLFFGVFLQCLKKSGFRPTAPLYILQDDDDVLPTVSPRQQFANCTVTRLGGFFDLSHREYYFKSLARFVFICFFLVRRVCVFEAHLSFFSFFFKVFLLFSSSFLFAFFILFY